MANDNHSVDQQELRNAMAKLDICMMTTVGSDGDLHSRPMSNNKNVEWDGDTWFFAYADSSQVQEIQRNPKVNLAYANTDTHVYVALTGTGEIVHDDEKKKELWEDAIERWIPEGPEADNVVLIKVSAHYAYYWSKEGDTEINL